MVALEQAGRDPVVIHEPDGRPIFNRSLAYQATDLFHSAQAAAMRSLIQTTFAAPFVSREHAAGRYSAFLRELPLASPQDLEELGKVEQMPKLEGKRMTMLITPKSPGKQKK